MVMGLMSYSKVRDDRSNDNSGFGDGGGASSGGDSTMRISDGGGAVEKGH